MDFIGHTVVNSTAILFSVSRLKRRFTGMGIDHRATWWIFGYTAFMSSIADVAPWVAWLFFGADRWNGLYAYFHHDPPWYWLIHPPFLMHWALDLLFHAPSGGWTPVGWVLEFAIWAFVLILYSWVLIVHGLFGSGKSE